MQAPIQRLLGWGWLALALLITTGCEQRSHNVRYEVSGSAAQTSLSYQNATGGSEQRDDAPPWSYQFKAQTGQYIALTVFNATLEGDVRCRLYVDGRLVSEARSVGGLKLAHCGGLAGISGQPTPTPP